MATCPRSRSRRGGASMPNYFLGNEDLVTTFDRVVRWDEIVPLSEGPDANVADTVSTWREVLSVAGEYIGSEVAKRARQVDELGVIRDNGRVSLSAPLQQNLKGLAALGLVGLSFPTEYGGRGVPFTGPTTPRTRHGPRARPPARARTTRLSARSTSSPSAAPPPARWCSRERAPCRWARSARVGAASRAS